MAPLLARAWVVAQLVAATAVLTHDFHDATGAVHLANEPSTRAATVFVFIDTECPISNGYAPELSRIASEYAPRGVQLYAVYSDPARSLETIRAHAKAYALSFPAVPDPDQQLAHALGATAVPEAVVLTAHGEVAYRGRIDDRHVDLGVRRASPHRQDLRVALDELLSGRAVSVPEAPSVGCAIPGGQP
jgi:hypothetical protein